MNINAGDPIAAREILRWNCVFLGLSDNAAGDAIAGVSGRIRFHVIGLGVNYQRGSATGRRWSEGPSSPIVTPGAITVVFAVPSAATVKFGMSPACGPSGLSPSHVSSYPD